MTNQERLAEKLNDIYYTHPDGGGRAIKERIDSGDLKILFGENNWPEGWYSDPYFNVSVPLALDIASCLPSVKEFKLHYWKQCDFHHVQFEYDGDTFIIQWYKIFTIHRKSDQKHHYTDNRYEIAGWFKQGKHKTSLHWHDCSKMFQPPFI